MIKQADISDALFIHLRLISEDNKRNHVISKHIAKWVNNNREAINPTTTGTSESSEPLDKDAILAKLGQMIQTKNYSQGDTLKAITEYNKMLAFYDKGEHQQDINIINTQFADAVEEEAYREQYFRFKNGDTFNIGKVKYKVVNDTAVVIPEND